MKKKLTAIIACLLCIMLMASGCSQKSSDVPKDSKNDIIATVNDEKLNGTIVANMGDNKITQADYNFVYSIIYSNMAQYSSYYGDDWENQEVEKGKKLIDIIKENTENQLKQMISIIELGKDNGVTVDKDLSKKVGETRDNIIEQNYQGTDNYKSFLEESHTTDKAVIKYLEIMEVYNSLYKKLTKQGGKAYIESDKIKADFLKEYKDKLRVKHVLVSTQPQQGENGESKEAKSDEEAQKIAKEVIAKLDKGEDFDKLIDEYNDDPGMKSGKFYVFGAGEMVPEFEEASKNLKAGEYTKEPVKTDYGYHIIKRYEIDEKMDEYTEYKKNKLDEKVMSFVEKKSKKMKASFNDKLINPELEAWAKERKEKAEKEKAAQDAQNAEASAPEAQSGAENTETETTTETK